MDVAWHPLCNLLAAVSASGAVHIWNRVYNENWSAFAPEFKELRANEVAKWITKGLGCRANRICYCTIDYYAHITFNVLWKPGKVDRIALNNTVKYHERVNMIFLERDTLQSISQDCVLTPLRWQQSRVSFRGQGPCTQSIRRSYFERLSICHFIPDLSLFVVDWPSLKGGTPIIQNQHVGTHHANAHL